MRAMAEDISRLSAALDTASRETAGEVEKAVRATVDRAVVQARQNASGYRHLPHYPATIVGETETSGATVTGKVGPERGGQGSLGHLIEYGSPTSGAHLHVNQAVEGQAGTLRAEMLRLARRLL